MNANPYPLLKGDSLFKKNELVYINKSSELEEYMSMMHKHDFIEIAYVISGKGNHIVGDNHYETSKGDLFIINYDVPHGFFPNSEGEEGPVVYNCVFMPKFLDSSLFGSIDFQDIPSSFLFKSLFPDNTAPLPDLNLRGTEFTEVGVLFNKMYSEYKAMEKGYCDIIRAYLIELIIKIFRYMELNKPRTVHPQNEELVNRAIDIKFFYEVFKKITGKTPGDYRKS